MRFYFAYGSNMWDEQMKKRCPQHRKVGHAVLPGYRWIITTRGYASVFPSPGDEVEGVLFEVSPTDEDALDGFEGVSSGSYLKVEMTVRCENQDKTALVYVDPITKEGTPKQEYIMRINAGLKDARLSDAYVRRQVRKFVPA
ncbi:gamma-glutamylcyclotransferase family protein [Roseimicrobium sp. ORNL1]|uniref:gamma-glutamylcyclotransferase family protein n=1 Tax=Roseimicrobium sp. ORNL1 TaxID=2711231 RepID=UPI0013E0FDD0|nr:gamma-glutamylcyclotransferase family protein [Roseimicrobium sp. ORNL1]QIF05574.1 gamma-glutamylcyclotransferase [Roseimicrobium sp. ORNL1]